MSCVSASGKGYSSQERFCFEAPDGDGSAAARLDDMRLNPDSRFSRAWAWPRRVSVTVLAVGLLAACASDANGPAAPDGDGSAATDPATTDSAVAEPGATDATGAGSDVTASDDANPASPGPDGGLWRATDVVDGDTLYVVGPGGELTVRVLGINTPESGECFSDEAADALEELVAGTDLVLVVDRSDVDQYGRSLRYVETADGLDVGAALVAGGYAISRRYEPDVARDALYSDLQGVARTQQVGLWAPDACGDPVVEGMVIEVEINANAPGDDSQNLNGEWVRFTSVADAPIDLKNWKVSDESASHRYSFDEFVLDPGRSAVLYTGCGDDGPGDSGVDEVFWCEGSGPIWNNAGDTVFLRDPSGNLVAIFAYGDSN